MSPSFGDTYESISLLNSTNLADYFDDFLGFLYDSHGCLHFTPSDIFLLVKTIPKNTPLSIKMYNEKTLPDDLANLQYFNKAVNSIYQIRNIAKIFSSNDLKLVVYPSLGRLFIYLNGQPKYQVKTLAGPPQYYRQAFSIQKDGLIYWDRNLNTPTDYGQYRIFGTTSHYLSATYYDNTIVPFGAWLLKYNGYWAFKEDDKWYALPQHIIEDLNSPAERRQYNYYDITEKDGKIISAKWASHDFGKYALMWSADGKYMYPELGYAEGELLFEQVTLVKDLSFLLTVPGTDEFDACILQNDNFMQYKDAYEFVRSKGRIASDRLDPEACSYFKLFNKIKLNKNDLDNLDSRVINAVNDYRAGNLPWAPWEKEKRQEEIGLYYYVRDYHLSFIKQAHYYKKILDDWAFWSNVRQLLRNDFISLGIYSPENRQMLTERWLNSRLEFGIIVPPKMSKKLSFTSFFTQEAETTVFTEREKDTLRGIIRLAASGEALGPEMKSVNALNEYNYGVLLNEMLGNLYKSHGCFHVSPRNIYLLHYLLPIGARIAIKNFKDTIDVAQYEKLPELASMVNFNEDLQELAKKFENPKDVAIAVYPSVRIWIIYINNKPFAKMSVETGPQSRVKIMLKRDKKGYPLFEKEIAYPSTPGNFYIFKKVDNYVSSLYYDLTIIPQGGTIKKEKDKWYFINERGSLEALPKSIKEDMNLPSNERSFSYYNRINNEKGELIEAKWGGNPFGQYPIITSANMKSQSPELIHTSGDLIMEQRQLVTDLVKILSAPKDSFEDCTKYSSNFDLYQACYEFVNDPTREDLLENTESGSYKLYQNIPLTSVETSAMPQDVFIAYKIVNEKEQLTKEEIDILIKEKIAVRQNNKLVIDMEKVYGILYDIYQYVVAIRKDANIYSTLKDNWSNLSGLRKALLQDFKTFVIKDQTVFDDFTKELTLKRVNLEKLSQKDAYILLEKILMKKGL